MIDILSRQMAIKAAAAATQAASAASSASSTAAAAAGVTAALSNTPLGAASASVSTNSLTMTTTGYATAGDGGHGLYRRVAAQPSHMARFRSTDRYLPSGATDATNGGWWELVPANGEINILQFGAKGNCVAGTGGAVSASGTAFTAGSAAFTSADAGKTIAIAGAGTGGATLVTTIAAYVSGTAVTLAAAASTTVSGTAFAYGTDDTAAFQSAYSALAAGTFSSLIVPNKVYLVNGAITLNQQVMTGWTVRHASQGGCTMMQAADNTPFYSFTVDIMHSCTFTGGTYQWVGSQAGKQSSAVFYWFGYSGGGSKSIFQCRFENMRCYGGYWTFRSETALFWGNLVQQVTHSSVGGFAYISGSAGNPRNVFDTVYITGGAAGEYLFKAAACTNFYEHVEVNGSAAGFLTDGGGGWHQGRHVAMEVMNFTTNTTIFNNINGFSQFDSIYISSITMSSGVNIYAFSDNNNSNGSATDIGLFGWSFSGSGITGQGAGSAFYAYGGSSQKKSRIRHLWNPVFSAVGATPASSLTNMGASASSLSFTVDDWTDTSRIQSAPASGTLTVALGSARNIVVGTALTAALGIVLPYAGGGYGCNMFDGMIFDVIKLASAGTTYAINIYQSDGTTLIGTIPAATASGKYSVMFTRGNLAGTGGGPGFFTHLPGAI